MLETLSAKELEELRKEALEIMWKKSAEEEGFLYPATVLKNGETIEFLGYAVCEETSTIYSIKSKGKDGIWSVVEGSIPGKSKYRNVSFSTEEGTFSERFHRVIASTCKLPIPRDPSVSEVDWDKTPESVKMLLAANVDVHHKDSNPENNHVSNLEYIAGHRNREHSKNHEAAKRKAARRRKSA